MSCKISSCNYGSCGSLERQIKHQIFQDEERRTSKVSSERWTGRIGIRYRDFVINCASVLSIDIQHGLDAQFNIVSILVFLFFKNILIVLEKSALHK